MGKPYNKVEKRKRRAAYLKRKKSAPKAKPAQSWARSASWEAIRNRWLFVSGKEKFSTTPILHNSPRWITSGENGEGGLVLLKFLICSHTVHDAVWVNKSVHNKSCSMRQNLLCCDQFIERTGMVGGINSMTLDVSGIIPGDWGKAESGWLAWPLWKSNRKSRCPGGRIHQFLWRRSRVVITRMRG